MKKDKQLSICFFGTYDRNYTSNRIILQGLRANNVEVIEINSEVPLTKLDNKTDMSWLALLKRILKKYKLLVEIVKNIDKIKASDVIYIAYPGHFDVIPAYIVGKLFKKKIVFFPVLVFYTGFVDDQGILNPETLLAKIIKKSEQFIYNLCDLVLPDTPLQKDHIAKLFNITKNKLKVLPIGADNTAYKYTPYKNLSKKINIVYYGLYTPLHGVEHIIEASRILKDDPDIKFTLVGQGNTFEENYNRAQKLGLKSVTFIHHVPQDEHFPILQKADIFFGFLQKHPSVERIIPNKVYQGLALGKVVVTADSLVMCSLFTHMENIYLCKPSNPQNLAETILALKDDPILRKKIADNGYILYKSKFTPKAIGKKFIEYISEF